MNTKTVAKTVTEQKNSYAEKLGNLRVAMSEVGIDGYLVPRADEYQGEFVAPYAERLKYISGFTGSGGIALILKHKAFVLSDGRYTVQLKQQTDSALFETGDYTKKKTGKWIAENADEGAVIGYDPWLHTPAQLDSIKSAIKGKGMTLKAVNGNLVDAIWHNQPSKPTALARPFPDKIAGKKSKEKCKLVGAQIEKQGGYAAIITSPDSVAWLLNMRGGDIDHIPSVLSYAIIGRRGNVRWFVDTRKIDDDVMNALGSSVTVCAPDEMAVQLMALSQEAQEADLPVLMDMDRTPVRFKTMLEERGAALKDEADPTIALKAIKTKAEQTAIRKAHIADGVALVKFLKWLDEAAPKTVQTEISVTQKLHEFRAQNPAFKDDSFPTIAGFGANGAIVHYRADEKTNAHLKGGSLLLIDSGGQYAGGDVYGTTDITRTVAIGDLPDETRDEIRENNTRVLQGHISLAGAKFPIGTVGAQVDTLARKALWDVGLDFAHGTGHGVGCYLAVHEDAANISTRGRAAFKPGMLISNEPGYYKEGAYGIRIENLVLVQEAVEEGMLCFETISFAPIDLKLIDADMLSKAEKGWLNAYHGAVFENLSPELDEKTAAWLEAKTQSI